MENAVTPSAHVAGEAALVERARAGDLEAYTALVDARLATTHRTALALVGDESAAGDATEKIFVRAWRDLPDVRESAGFGDWFRAIVEDTCRAAAGGPRRAIVRDSSSASTAGGTLRQRILSRVATTSQRPAPRATRVAPSPIVTSRRARLAGILAIAVLGVALVAVVVQSRQPAPPPFRTGLVAFIRNGDVYLAEPDGSDPTVVVHQDGLAFSKVVWSPDGRRLAVDGDAGVVVFDTATGAATVVGGFGPVWSPNGQQIAVVDYKDDGVVVRVQDIESGVATTHVVGAARDLAWSPDGRWLVASGSASFVDQRQDVLIKLDLASGKVETIETQSSIGGAPRQPTWSPGAFRIAFAAGPRGGFGRGCDASMCDSDVYTANPDGTRVMQLNDPTTVADQPAWSPNGRWVAMRQIARSDIGSFDATSDPDADVGLVLVAPDLTETRTLVATDVQAFAWSPEGDRLRYVRSGGRGHASTVWEVSIDDERPVSRSLGLAIDPMSPYSDSRVGFGVAWQSLARAVEMAAVPSVVPPSPGAEFAIVTPATAPPADPSVTWPKLAVESIDGCEPPALIATADGTKTPVGKPCFGGNSDIQSQWSPTGALHARLDGVGRLFVTDLDGVERTNIADLYGLSGFAWSPGGTWLSVSGAPTIVSGTRPTVTGTGDRILRPDGSDERELPGQPTWSPDDRRLWIIQADGTLLVGQGDGTGLRSVGSFPEGIAMSSDGSRFAFVRSGDVWTAAADGTDLRNATGFPLGGASTVAWSPDGRRLAVGMPHGIWLMRPDGSDRRALLFDSATSIGNAIWARDGARLAVEVYSESSTGSVVTTYLVDPDRAEAIRVDAASGAIWSPDGRFLVASHVDPSTGGGWEVGRLEVMNGDGSGRHEIPITTNGAWVVWVQLK